jgi:GNAT superfamily N-acetyltransferase
LAAIVERAAHHGDAEAIAAFLAERFSATFGHTYRPADLAAFLAQTYTPDALAREIDDPSMACRLAHLADGEEQGRLVGVAQMGAMGLPLVRPPDEAARELKRLYLAEAVKGVGLADRLMDWAFAVARAGGANTMYVGVWSENERAKRFYARHGFRHVGVYHFVVGEARDVEWILRAPV